MARRALSGMSIGVHVIAAHYLLNQGTEEQKRRYLPRMARIKRRHAHGCAVGGASASRNRRFESVPLHRRVSQLSVPELRSCPSRLKMRRAWSVAAGRLEGLAEGRPALDFLGLGVDVREADFRCP
jgi:hypothetical protein